MSLVKSHSDSNASKGGGDDAAASGGPEMTGFSKPAYPTQGPAKSNKDISTTKDGVDMGNDGTNMSAYKDQEPEPNSETGK